MAHFISRYTLVVRIEKEVYTCGGYLEVKDADPEYFFAKKFKEEMSGYTNRRVKIICHLNVEGARIKWYKDGKVISVQWKNSFEVMTIIRSRSIYPSSPTVGTRDTRTRRSSC